jgi:CO/xanthine dehydrogenase Mo-binding subunit
MHPIGTSPPRPDGQAKVTGTLRYADDLAVPRLWFGATLRSPHPHARFCGVAWDGPPPTDCVLVTAADLGGSSGVVNGVQLLDDSWPILAADEVRHVGEAVALVAAPTAVAARRALARLVATYEPLPAIVDLDAAAAAVVAGNALPLYELSLGASDVSAALAAAPLVIEGTYRTGHQEHIYIEPQTMTASWEADGGLAVVGSMQCPYYVHKALTHAFGLADDDARVLASAVGGGFGGKEDFPSAIALHAALLARASGHPVRLVYDRHEDIVATTKRHPATVRLRTGVDRDGKLLAMDIELLMDGGAYLTLSPVVLSRAALHATGAYRCPAVRVHARALATHTAPNGAFRGFGAPQTQLAAERHLDHVARRLGIDPLTIRRRNLLRPGDRLPTGQILGASSAASECLEKVASETDFLARWQTAEAARDRADGTVRGGLGISLFFHGAGFTGNGERRMRSPIEARLRADGRLEVATAMIDMGQGCAAIFPQIAAAAGGLASDDLVFVAPDTRDVPDSGPTVASRTTMIVGGLIVRVVGELTARVRAWAAGESLAAASFGDQVRRYLAAGGEATLRIHHEPPAWQEFDDSTYRGAAYPTYAWGAAVVEVAVDADTLAVRPTQVTTACDVGRAIHPVLCRGQLEGGTLQAIAWGYLEEVKLRDGRYLNDRLATYIIPTAMDAPRMAVHLLEHPWEGGPFGAKGIGELPMDGGAPAILQAIENATGIRADALPASPERLLAWQRAGQTVDALAPSTPERA